MINYNIRILHKLVLILVRITFAKIKALLIYALKSLFYLN
jgi:hypothetical protein